MKSDMKLKEIPANTIIHTPTEAEAKELLAILHENGWKWNIGQSLIEKTRWHNADSCYCLHPDRLYVTWSNIFDKNVLTLAEFKERYADFDDTFTDDCKSHVKVEEKPQPKFKVGDKIRIIQDDSVNPAYVGIVDEIANISYRFQLKNTDSNWSENVLEPYTEPETKDKAKEAKGETKELNLCELLEGHEGETIFLTTMGNVIIHSISERSIQFKIHETAKDIYSLPSSGKMNKNGLVIAIPSLALYEQYPLDPYTAWMKWQEEQKKFGLDIKIETYFEGKFGWEDCDDDVSCLHFRTPADRDKCIEDIKAIIEKYSEK